jgi:hypothetical protein
MTKDPDAEVRRVALHLEKDALELMGGQQARAASSFSASRLNRCSEGTA